MPAKTLTKQIPSHILNSLDYYKALEEAQINAMSYTIDSDSARYLSDLVTPCYISTFLSEYGLADDEDTNDDNIDEYTDNSMTPIYNSELHALLPAYYGAWNEHITDALGMIDLYDAIGYVINCANRVYLRNLITQINQKMTN